MPLQQWEYLTVALSDPAQPEGVNALNSAGLDGWEAVAAVQAEESNVWRVLLKRPVQAHQEHGETGYRWAGPGSPMGHD